MKSINKKIFFTLMSLLLAITSFVSVTFAWLSMNSDAWVEGMEFQVTAGEGFLMSVDGNIFKSNLTKSDIIKAIVSKYNPEYTFDEYGNLVNELGDIESDFEEIMKRNIKLFPCTSYGSDSLELTNISGSKETAESGKFIEFDLSFKAISEHFDKMDIYLNGSDSVAYIDGVEYIVPKTELKSEKENIVKLSAGLVTFVRNKENYGDAYNLYSGDELLVSSHNAIRLGVIDDNNESLIIELSDENDLGSYATNILDYTTEGSEAYDSSIVYDAKYDATKNAMFTFYNGLKNKSLEAIDYKAMPKTYKSLVDEEGFNIVRVCSLTTKQRVKKITFKLWLEGWDADSIEGIVEAISVQLSFAHR